MRSTSSLLLVTGCLVFLGACAGPSWEHVRGEDTIAAYRRYLADHPQSKHGPEARERLAILQLERTPTLDGLESFRRAFPGSAALPSLTERVAEREFDRARIAATADAYSLFLDSFPNSSLTARAEGNRIYVQAGGFANDPVALAHFVSTHPESDYAMEAKRVVGGQEARRGGRFTRVSLEIAIAPNVPESARLRSVFAKRAHEAYAHAGIPLIEGTGGDATLRIEHVERAVAASADGTIVASPGVLAETRVSLHAAGRSAPEFDDRLDWRVPDAEVPSDGSALFARSAAGYWERFFVPIASWPTSAARRTSWAAGRPLAGVGVEVGQAVVVASDGSFRELDLSDPTHPRVIGQYRREGAPARFEGVRRVGSTTILYGEDGVEIVERTASGERRVASFDRGAVGAVAGVEPFGKSLLIAGTRGLIAISLEVGTVDRRLERPLRGIARVGETLYLLDDQWIYAGPVADLRAPAFFTAAEVGRGLDPRRLRAVGSRGLVIGAHGVAVFEFTARGPARPLARLRTGEVGAVADAAILGDSVFVLGERGLLIADPESGRIHDSIDVAGRDALAVAGMQILTIGDASVDVVDASPWVARSVPASGAP